MFLTRFLASPPKSPRNIFFPWQNLCIHRSGAFLERNRLALRVPVNLTKFEISQYLQKLYGAKVIKVNTLIKVPRVKRDLSSKTPRYYRNGPIYKKAIITLEHAVPDEVKMLGSDFELGRNPAILKTSVTYGKKGPQQQSRTLNIQAMGSSRALSSLFSDDWEFIPHVHEQPQDDIGIQMAPDAAEAHVHGEHQPLAPSANTKSRAHPVIDLRPWRTKLASLDSSEMKGEATSSRWRYPPAK